MSAQLDVAVVGAGAVGAVYGHHLKRGGARVTFVVRPKYVDDVKRGIRLWRGAREEMCTPDDVVDDVAKLSGRPLDQVWVCVPSTGLDESGIERIAQATAAHNALYVDMSPGIDGRSLRILSSTGGRERLVDGLIPFIAYQSPLPGVTTEPAALHNKPGIAYWLPPLAPTTLSGPGAPHAADALKRGGMGARVVDDADTQRALGSALLMSVIATLEVSGWSLRACRRRLDGAAREALEGAARAKHTSTGALALLASPLALRTVLWLAERVAPLPLEPYLKFHFTKVGAQTREMMRAFIGACEVHGVDAPALRALAAARPALAPATTS